jgi:uncharacterized membrane protein
MNPELLDNYLPVRLSNSHVISALSLSFFVLVGQISTIPTLSCKGAWKKQLTPAAAKHRRTCTRSFLIYLMRATVGELVFVFVGSEL